MNKRIHNIFGEDLDVAIEGNPDSNRVLIFVHGFGTDKNEGFSSFLDAADFFKNDFITIRFDQSGYGQSEGEDYEFQFQKAAGDLDSIIRYARREYPDKELYIAGHSLGTFVVALLSPFNIKKIALTSVPNSKMEFIIETLQKRILSKGGEVDEQRLTRYPRTSGAVQLIGRDFWRTLRNFDPISAFEELGSKTDLIILKPLQDEVLEYKYFDDYKNLKNAKYVELNGDHNFKKPEDRKALNELIKEFFLGEK